MIYKKSDSLIFLMSLISLLYFPTVSCQNDSATQQLVSFLKKNPLPTGFVTTSSGYPVSYDDRRAINTRLLLNDFFYESMTHMAMERLPERLVHAKGAGAFGSFKVTHDLSDICKAKLFDTAGKETPVAVRFSPSFQKSGGSDLAREVRGFAVKFYTEEGNYDYLSLTSEVFFIKDPLLFPAYGHSFHKNPVTNTLDYNSKWDFLTLNPESVSFQLRLMGDRGIPDGYRYMPGFAIHTFELTNAVGDRTYVRFHLLPDLGIRNLTTVEAKNIQAEDTDYALRDLYNAIDSGDYPTWTLNVQTISEKDIDNVDFDIFDVTRFWPYAKFPLREIGKMVLNRNPENYFADIEQLAFNPGNLVRGIRGVDTVFEARVLTYRLANLHRLGVNFANIAVNCPFRTVRKTYNSDGRAPVGHNGKDAPNYYPNTFNGPVPFVDNTPPRISVFTDPNPNNFDQAGELYYELPEAEKCRLVDNIVSDLSSTKTSIQEKAVKLYKLVNEDLSSRVAYGLKLKK